jgi:hypothetical protein
MDIANFLLNLVILLCVAFILFDRYDTPDKRQAVVKKVKRKINHEHLGAIQKLTPEELSKKGTRLEETELAMEDVLKDMFGEGGSEEVKEYYKDIK